MVFFFNDNNDFSLVIFLLIVYCFSWLFFQSFIIFNYILQIKFMFFFFSTATTIIIVMVILIIMIIIVIK